MPFTSASPRHRTGKVGSASSRAPTGRLLGIGIILAAYGQLMLLGIPDGAPDLAWRQALAGCLLIAGALVFGVGAARLPRRSTAPVFAPLAKPGEAPSALQPRVAIAVSVALTILAIAVLRRSGEGLYVTLLWIASLSVLLGSQFLGHKLTQPTGLRDEAPYLIALLIVLAVALFARVYRLEQLPLNVDGDFASFGLQARALVEGTERRAFGFGWAAIPLQGYWPAALTMRLFGNNLLGLRASGVLAGMLSLIGVYLLGRELFHARVGLLGAALLAVSYTHIAASREAAFMDPVPYLVFSIYFFILGLRGLRGWAMVLSGFMAALCLEMYYSGRILFPILAVVLLYLFILHRAELLNRGGWILLWLIATLVALGPMLVGFSTATDAFIGRSRDVFILHPAVIRHTMGGYGVDTLPAMLLEQARRTAFMFHFYPDMDTQFSFKRPFLDPVTATLFTLGLGVAVFRLRSLGYAVITAWIALGVFVGAFLTVNPPFWTRLMVLLPPVGLLAAFPLNTVTEYILGRGEGRRDLRPHAVVVIVLLVALIGVGNWNTYARQGSYANGLSRIARYVASQDDAARAYLVTSSDWTYRLREFEFLIPGRFVGDLRPEQVGPGLARAGSPTILILTGEQAALAKDLPQILPGGELQTGEGNAPGEVAFYAYFLP